MLILTDLMYAVAFTQGTGMILTVALSYRLFAKEAATLSTRQWRPLLPQLEGVRQSGKLSKEK